MVACGMISLILRAFFAYMRIGMFIMIIMVLPPNDAIHLTSYNLLIILELKTYGWLGRQYYAGINNLNIDINILADMYGFATRIHS